MLTCLSQLDGARKVTGVASGAGQVGDYRSPTLEHRKPVDKAFEEGTREKVWEGPIAFVSFDTTKSKTAFRNGATDFDSSIGFCPKQISKRIMPAARAAGLGNGYMGNSPRFGMEGGLAMAGKETLGLMNAGRRNSSRMPAS